MAKSTFDMQAFFGALDAARRERTKNWKEIAGDAKVSASTLTRLDGRRAPGGFAHEGLSELRWALFEAAKCGVGVGGPDHDSYATVAEAWPVTVTTAYASWVMWSGCP